MEYGPNSVGSVRTLFILTIYRMNSAFSVELERLCEAVSILKLLQCSEDFYLNPSDASKPSVVILPKLRCHHLAKRIIEVSVQ
ncbi:hypothetical protein IFM89_014098 [Coptis chinensis]|uniref:Uncharacterized protein n=1 Tax=Coptis chinensis TaxID=261450 RepID=A0A835GXF5_9MAGN|nr:hypothetical protein IFM89_014098 [Coptis chinensis]